MSLGVKIQTTTPGIQEVKLRYKLTFTLEEPHIPAIPMDIRQNLHSCLGYFLAECIGTSKQKAGLERNT